jgi:uncharacterized protein (TIGR01777 family)
LKDTEVATPRRCVATQEWFFYFEENVNMRIIITGGTGLVGTWLATDLVKDGHETIVLSRNPDRYQGKMHPDIRLERWDAKSAAGWGALADGADAIVNLAGENLAGGSFFPARWTEERKRLILDSRVDAGNAVVEAVKAAKNKPKVVIQASAVGYYGPQGDQEIHEDHPVGTDFLARVCIPWENTTKAVEELGVRHVVTRIAGIVLSADQGALWRLLLPYRMFVGGPMGNGKQWYTWLHPDDEVGAFRFLIENENASGTFNLTAPEPLRNADFGKAIGKVLNRPSWLPVPGFAFQLAFGEVSNVVLTGQKVLPRRLQEMGYEFKFKDTESALRDILKK